MEYKIIMTEKNEYLEKENNFSRGIMDAYKNRINNTIYNVNDFTKKDQYYIGGYYVYNNNSSSIKM